MTARKKREEHPGSSSTCAICGKRCATLRVRKVEKSGTVDIDICADCAGKSGFTGARPIKAGVADVLADIKQSVSAGDDTLVCPDCGSSFADFKRKGRLGCAGCYPAFADQLRPLIRRIQGAVRHVGRTARTGRRKAREKMTLNRLRDELDAAVAAEDYEQAARVRDELDKVSRDVER